MANRGIEQLSDQLQNIFNTLLGAKGKGRHPLKTLLNGSWLGHPLHPLITDIAVGGVVFSALFDIAWLAFPEVRGWAPRAAEVTLIAGTLGMIGAFFTGWTDWSDTYGSERSTGLLHGSLNTLALILSIISTILRLQVSTGQSIPAAVLNFVGLGIIGLAAYLGGDLVFKFGTNVNHTAWEHRAEEYTSIGPLAQIADGKLTRVEVGGVPVVVLRHGEQLVALAATCSHAGGPLDEGELVEQDVVKCPWHGSRFQMKTGKVVDGPATISQPTYDVRVQGGQVELKRR